MQLFNPFPRPFLATPTATAAITFPGPISVRFDVTNDVRYFIDNPLQNFGWILQGAASTPWSGTWAHFGSRETGAPPRLLMDLAPACPAGLAKTTPGICGCYLPDVDSDNDGTFDCQDQCPNDIGQAHAGRLWLRPTRYGYRRRLPAQLHRPVPREQRHAAPAASAAVLRRLPRPAPCAAMVSARPSSSAMARVTAATSRHTRRSRRARAGWSAPTIVATGSVRARARRQSRTKIAPRPIRAKPWST